MIISTNKATILSSLGWIEKGAIWCLRPDRSVEPELIRVSDEHITLTAGSAGYFTVSYAQEEMVAQIRHFDSPADVLAEARIGDTQTKFSGNVELFKYGKQDFLPYFMWHGKAVPHYVSIDPSTKAVTKQALSWFLDLPLDHGYQGPIDVLRSPKPGVRWITIARSSNVMLYDVASNAVGGWLSLGNRGGNPKLQPFVGGWLAMDYDTLVEIDIPKNAAKRSILMQPETSTEIAPGYQVPSQQFAGDFFVADRMAYVARPFSGDVAVVDIKRFKIRQTVPVTGQPLEIVCGEDRIYTRDWQTGVLCIALL